MSAPEGDGPAGMAGILFTETLAIPSAEATTQRPASLLSRFVADTLDSAGLGRIAELIAGVRQELSLDPAR